MTLLEPQGIVGATGVAEVNYGSLTDFTYLWALRAAPSIANAMPGSFAFNAEVEARYATRLDADGNPLANFITADGRVIGRPYAVSNLMPGNATTPTPYEIVYGDFSKLMVLFWGDGMEILVNPYAATPYSKGNVQIRGIASANVVIAQPAAFAFSDDGSWS